MPDETKQATFEADPEKYARLSQPIPSQAAAEAKVKDFLTAVGELRERFGIPDLIVHFEVNVQTFEGVQTLSGGCGWGDQLKQARLARRAADREFLYLGKLIENAAAAMPDLWRMLITDPSAEAERGKPL